MNINPFELLKNAEALQKQMQTLQDSLETIVVTGTAGAGIVELDMNGKMEMIDLRFSPEAGGDLEMLGDLVIAAHSDALEKIRVAIGSEFGMGAGMPNLGGLGNLLGGGR